MRRALVLFVLYLIPLASFATSTYEKPVLQARTNFTDGYQLPAYSNFSPQAMSLAPDGSVAISLNTLDGQALAALWAGKEGKGKVVHKGDDSVLFTDLNYAESGVLLFHSLSMAEFSVGFFGYDAKKDETSLLLDPKALGVPVQYLGDATLSKSGELGLKIVTPESARAYVIQGAKGLQHVVKDANLEEKSPYAYLFTLKVSSVLSFAAKVRLGLSHQLDENRPDKIVRWDRDGVERIVAEDADARPGSPYLGFDNSVALNAKGQVAFGARLKDQKRGIFLFDGSQVRTIATTESGELTELGTLALNDQGEVAYTGRDKQGRDVIFVSDGTATRRVAREGDVVDTDRGRAVLRAGDRFPVFGIRIALNNSSEVAFTASLKAAGTGEALGDGLFVVARSGR